MADEPIEALGGKTPMQYADTPYMDKLAEMGVTGRMKTVADGFHPGSEVANMAVLGYDLPTVYEGRGVLEAASIGYDLKPGEMAMRCNLICVEGDILKNHSSGHITTEEADELIRFLNEKLGSDRIHFYTGVSYRHLLVVKGGDKRLDCTPPHDVPLHPFRPLMIKPEVPEAQETADLLNNLILQSQEILKDHPVNLAHRCRERPGKQHMALVAGISSGYANHAGNVWLQAGFRHLGRRSDTGHSVYAGLEVIDVEGATGLYDTNYEGKAHAALEALKTNDFVYLHVEASDEAGHEGDVDLKIRTIENLDKRAIGILFEELQKWDEPVAIAVLPDHPTPCAIRTHTNTPVPFLIYKPGQEPDSVTRFDEFSVLEGKYGILEKDEFIKRIIMKILQHEQTSSACLTGRSRRKRPCR